MQIGILENNDFSKKAIDKLSTAGKVILLRSSNIKGFLKDKEVVFTRLKYYFDKELLDHASRLRYICSPTTGLNHIDLQEIQRRHIKIISLKDEFGFLSTIRATPEHTFGLVIALLRNYKNAFLNENNQIWNREIYKGKEIYGKSIGIIGLGRVGKILAQYFNAFGARVFFFDINNRLKSTSQTQKTSTLEDLLKISDIVIMTASYSEKNKLFFNKKYINLLKNKYFINTARGELIDEEYLINKIKANYFEGIALDVITNEPGKNNNLLKLINLTRNRNFILTSHIAGATHESMQKTEEFIAAKLISILNTHESS